jgi:hypothetical protein
MFEKTIAALKAVEEAIAEEVKATSWHSGAGILADLHPGVVSARQTLEAKDPDAAPEATAPVEETPDTASAGEPPAEPSEPVAVDIPAEAPTLDEPVNAQVGVDG